MKPLVLVLHNHIMRTLSQGRILHHHLHPHTLAVVRYSDPPDLDNKYEFPQDNLFEAPDFDHKY